MLLKKLIFLPCIFLICTHISAQQPQSIFDHYTTDDGLSNNSCNTMVQDEDGFIWIGTNSGLNRFDGKDFVKFYSTDSPNSLLGNNIWDLACLAHHGLAVATSNGLGILNTETGICRRVIIPADTAMQITANSVVRVTTDKQNHIIVGTGTGVYVFNAALQLIFRYDAFTKNDIGKKRIEFNPWFYVLPDGRILLFAANYFIYVLNIKEKSLLNIRDIHDNEFELLKKWNGMEDVISSGNQYGQFMFINYGKPVDSIFVVDILHQKTFASSTGFSVKNQIHWHSRISFLNDSIICISSSYNNGIYLLHYNRKTLQLSASTNMLPGSFCDDFLIARDNRLWACSDEGVFKQSFIKSAFHDHILPVNTSSAINQQTIGAFLHYQHKYFILQWDIGLLVYDDSLHLIKTVSFHTSGKENFPWNISCYTKDTLLITTQAGSLLLNVNDYRLKNFWLRGMPGVLDSNATTCSLIDSHQQLWMGVGTGNGVFKIDMQTHAWTYFSPKVPKAVFKLRYPQSIAQDSKENVWLSSPEGITRWNPLKQTFDTLITQLPGIGNILGMWNFFTIDGQDNMWIAEKDFVLVKWNLNSGNLTLLPRPENILPARAITVSGPWQDRIWVETQEGLLTFNIKTNQFSILKKADGLIDNEVTGRLYFDTATQKLFVGFLNAFTWFCPDDVLKQRPPVETTITSIRNINDSASLSKDSTLSFPYKNNSLAFSFTGINYNDGRSNTYAYRLFEKKPSSFINIGEQKTITFANLKPGDYTFQVKTILSDGTVSAKPASVNFSIAYPYYETWWFYLLTAITFAVLLAAIFYASFRIKLEKRMALQAMRNNIADDLHDDIGSTLSSISIMSELAKDKSPEAASLISRISDSAASIQENMSDIVWSVNPKNDSLENVLQRMNHFAASMLEAKNMRLNFQSRNPATPLKLSMDQRKNFYMFFKEAINNAAKYSASEKVDVMVNQTDHQIEMMIQDYGKGFDVANAINGNGMRTLKKRAAELNGDFKIQSAINEGTTIKLKFKIT